MRLRSLALVAASAAHAWAQSLSGDADSKDFTEFDSVKVPPLLELTPSNFEEEMNQTRFLMVKHYSPYCPHCIDFAPAYQTIYEFYHTSKPKAEPESTFLQYYDFRFGMINCVAYTDLCTDHQISSFPTTIIYEKGEEFEKVQGAKNMTVLSEAIEQALEKSRPGTRPKHVKLPDRGDKVSPKPDPGDESEELPPPKKDEGKKADHVGDKADAPFGSDWKVSPAGEKAKNDKGKNKGVVPNPNGVSEPLTAESFQRLVTMTQDAWFIKFYAPWCPHCQAMRPTWEQVAKTMAGKLRIGEVNCDQERHLCKDVNARAYPTILLFKGGERVEYQGLRGLGDFVQYCEKAAELGTGVPDVDAETFQALEQKEDVIFTYFYDHATTSEDLAALERLPLSLIGHAKLVKTNDPKLYTRFKISTWPRLMVSREGRPTYYPPLTPEAMRDVNGVLDWMKSVWLPLVPELTVTNARQVMDGKMVVLGVLNREEEDSFLGSLRELKSAANEWMDRQIQEFQLERKKLRDAKQMRIEEAEDRDDERGVRAAKSIRINMDTSGRKEVGFAWVDGNTWQRWIRTTYGIDSKKDGEKVIINDEDTRKYWDTTVTGNHILVSRTSIMETLDKIVYGPQVIKPKLTVSFVEKIIWDLRTVVAEHPWLSLGCTVGIILGGYSWLRSRSRRARAGHFRLDDNMGMKKEFNNGFLGAANGNQKAD